MRHGEPLPAGPYLLNDFPGDLDVLIGLATPMGEWLEEERAGQHQEDLCPELRSQ